MRHLNWVVEIKRRSAVIATHTSCYGMNKYTPYLFGIPFIYRNVVYLDSSLRKVKEEDELLKLLLREAFENNQHYFLDIAKRIRTDGSIISSFVRQSLTAQKVSNTEQKHLQRLFESYISMMTHFGTYYRFMEPATSTLEAMMIEMLRGRISDPSARQEAFLTLSVSHEHDYVAAERRSLLSIAADADRKLGYGSRRNLPAEEYVQRLKSDPELLCKLEQHAQAYSWMGAPGHQGRPYEIDQYAAFVHEIDLDDIAAELERLRQQDRLRVQQSQTLAVKLHLSPREMRLVQSTQEYDYLNGFIKEIVTSSRQRAEHLLVRISRILDVELETLVNLTFEEILLYLRETKALDQDMLRKAQERKEDWAMLISGPNITLYSGDELRVFRAQFQEPDYHHLFEVRGISASPGRTIASARVIDTKEEFSKIQRGDIVIASMTTPEYSAVMDKIGGIITDEGGVTSHAGSIAREKGIPCLVGTRIATKVFEDDDAVELNADAGVARKTIVHDGETHMPPKEEARILIVDDVPTTTASCL